MAGEGLTEDQLAVVRSWVGEAPEESALHERFNRLHDVDGAVLEELRTQYTEMLATPQLSVDGLNISYAGNLQALRDRINQFISEGGTGLDDTPLPGRLSISRIKRFDPR